MAFCYFNRTVALGTLIGSLFAFLIAVSHQAKFSYGVGATFLAGGIAAAIIIPAPLWFIILDLLVAYMPMAWIGIRLGQCLTTKEKVGCVE